MRPILDKKKIQECHDIVDELVRLHKETNPAKASTKYKNEKAYQALNHIGMLAAILTEWAEAHIIGAYNKLAKSKDKWIDDDTTNSHENELMWYKEKPPTDFFENEEHLMCYRTAIASIIYNTFRLSGATGWRAGIAHSLRALNDGQVDYFLRPTNTKLQGDGYDLSNLKWAAVEHVYKLVGEGWKKTAAQQRIAEYCGTTFESIKKWEKIGIYERDREKVHLKGMQRGAEAITLFKKFPDYNEYELRLIAANMCISMIWAM